MKGAITNQGNLFLYRPRPVGGANRFEYVAVKAECPFNRLTGIAGNSGDNCPSFHEPQDAEDGLGAKIEICSGTIFFSEFIDERKGM